MSDRISGYLPEDDDVRRELKALRTSLAEKDRRIAELEARGCLKGRHTLYILSTCSDCGHDFAEASCLSFTRCHDCRTKLTVEMEASAFHHDVLDILTSVQTLQQAYDEISGWDPMRRREG